MTSWHVCTRGARQKGVDPHVQDHARRYLAIFRHFTFSIITRYEILRGLRARRATPYNQNIHMRLFTRSYVPAIVPLPLVFSSTIPDT
jgi:hypothetical protein